MENTKAIEEAEVSLPQEIEAEKVSEPEITDEAEATSSNSDEGEEHNDLPDETKKFTVPVKFNHEKIELSPDEAALFAQKGMQSQAIMDKLRYLAAANSCGVQGLVERLIKNDEEQYLREVMEKTNGDETLAQQLLDSRREKIESGLADSANVNERERQENQNLRIADEFLSLNKEFPEITSIDSVPDSVIIRAVQENISLFDSYLRYRHSEEARISEERQRQKTTAGASTGSQADCADSGISPEISAMLKGVFGD